MPNGSASLDLLPKAPEGFVRQQLFDNAGRTGNAAQYRRLDPRIMAQSFPSGGGGGIELAAELPPQQRAAFVLRHIEGLATAEVAEALECGVSTVRSHVAEARRTLQRTLRARYPELLGDR